MNVTMIPDLPEHEYHADPCKTPSLSSSIANLLLSKSPKHAWLAHPKLGGQPIQPTKEMDEGSLIHAILLGRQHQVSVIDADDFRKNATKELRDEARANGQTPILRKKFEHALHAATVLRQKIAAYGFDLDAGCNEVTFFWQEGSRHGDVPCRARLDHVNLNEGLILDLKKSESAHPRACEKHVLAYGYHIQEAAYRRAVEKNFENLSGRLKFTFLFVEMKEPYPVTPGRLSGVLRELGERQWERATATWADCLKFNRWPEYVEGPVQLDAPGWLAHELAETG